MRSVTCAVLFLAALFAAPATAEPVTHQFTG